MNRRIARLFAASGLLVLAAGPALATASADPQGTMPIAYGPRLAAPRERSAPALPGNEVQGLRVAAAALAQGGAGDRAGRHWRAYERSGCNFTTGCH